MIQVIALHVEAELHVVRALGPAGIGAPLDLIVGVIAHLARRGQRPPTHVELRRRPIARARRLTRVWYAELGAPALHGTFGFDPAVIRRVAEHAVDDERRRDDG